MSNTSGVVNVSDDKTFSFEGKDQKWVNKRKSMLIDALRILKAEIIELNNNNVHEFDHAINSISYTINKAKEHVLIILDSIEIQSTKEFDGKEFLWIKHRNKVCKRLLQILKAEKVEMNKNGFHDLDASVDYSIAVVFTMQNRVISIMKTFPDERK